MRALRIDPDHRTVRSIDVALVDVMDLLSTPAIATIDFLDGHCLVIDDSEHTTDHPVRFRFTDAGIARPLFGRVLVFGANNGHWSPATLSAADVERLLVWEEWQEADGRFVAAHAVAEAV